MQVLIVDAANVVGSRPDGWWRDRPGAARRLWDRLTVATLPYDEIVLVLEGAAKAGVPAGLQDKVRTTHADGDGDDTIVAETEARVRDGSAVTVVTADRGLQARVLAGGAKTTGPSWLLDLL
jgi:hypothetical protein